MIKYFISKFLYYVSILIAIVIFSFFLFHVIPTDPARIILGPNADDLQVNRLRKELGLDKPLYLQLAIYLKKLLIFDFGYSFVDQRNVSKEVWNKFKITISLIAICFALIILYLAVILYSMILPFKKWSDFFEFAMSSMPIFFSGIIIAILMLHYYPVTSFSGEFSFYDFIYLIPPALVLAFYPISILSGILKEELSSSLTSLYIIVGRAFGFQEITILFKYTLRNSLIPLLSALSNILPMLVTGAFIIEIIFSIPGIGRLLISSILNRDFPTIECTVILNGVFFILTNLIFESLYPIIDPRIVKEMK